MCGPYHFRLTIPCIVGALLRFLILLKNPCLLKHPQMVPGMYSFNESITLACLWSILQKRLVSKNYIRKVSIVLQLIANVFHYSLTQRRCRRFSAISVSNQLSRKQCTSCNAQPYIRAGCRQVINLAAPLCKEHTRCKANPYLDGRAKWLHLISIFFLIVPWSSIHSPFLFSFFYNSANSEQLSVKPWHIISVVPSEQVAICPEIRLLSRWPAFNDDCLLQGSRCDVW